MCYSIKVHVNGIKNIMVIKVYLLANFLMPIGNWP